MTGERGHDVEGGGADAARKLDMRQTTSQRHWLSRPRGTLLMPSCLTESAHENLPPLHHSLSKLNDEDPVHSKNDQPVASKSGISNLSRLLVKQNLRIAHPNLLAVSVSDYDTIILSSPNTAVIVDVNAIADARSCEAKEHLDDWLAVLVQRVPENAR